MKLLHVAAAVVLLSATFAVPAFARDNGEEVSDGSLVELQGDAVKAGSTDAALRGRTRPGLSRLGVMMRLC